MRILDVDKYTQSKSLQVGSWAALGQRRGLARVSPAGCPQSPSERPSAALQDNTNLFISNIQTLQSLVEKYVGSIDQQVRRQRSGLLLHKRGTRGQASDPAAPGRPSAQVEKLEAEKLKAIGLRNKVAAISEVGERGSSAVYRHGPSPVGCTRDWVVGTRLASHVHLATPQERKRKQKEQERMLSEKQEELER